MADSLDFSIATSEQIEGELCRRLERLRLSRNKTQVQLAREAGVSPRTIGRLGNGEGVSLDTFIRVMMALGIQQHLEALLPDPSVRPVERLGLTGRERKRARPDAAGEAAGWSWADEGGDAH